MAAPLSSETTQSLWQAREIDSCTVTLYDLYMKLRCTLWSFPFHVMNLFSSVFVDSSYNLNITLNFVSCQSFFTYVLAARLELELLEVMHTFGHQVAVAGHTKQKGLVRVDFPAFSPVNPENVKTRQLGCLIMNQLTDKCFRKSLYCNNKVRLHSINME